MLVYKLSKLASINNEEMKAEVFESRVLQERIRAVRVKREGMKSRAGRSARALAEAL